MIKNLIFDVGNVLVGYRWKEMLMDDFGLNDSDAERIGHELFNDHLWTEFDRGALNIDQVIKKYTESYPGDESIIRRFFHEGEKMRVPREDIWEQVVALKNRGYNIYLLSNYSKYLFEKHTNGSPVIDILDGRIVSYEVNLLKPQPEIYNCLIDKYDLKVDECVFFDDLSDNVSAARKLGIKSYEVISKEYLSIILDRYLTGEYGEIQEVQSIDQKTT